MNYNNNDMVSKDGDKVTTAMDRVTAPTDVFNIDREEEDYSSPETPVDSLDSDYVSWSGESESEVESESDDEDESESEDEDEDESESEDEGTGREDDSDLKPYDSLEMDSDEDSGKSSMDCDANTYAISGCNDANGNESHVHRQQNIFSPGNGELVEYLRKKNLDILLDCCPIKDADVYAIHPRELAGMYPNNGEKVWYFFSRSRPTDNLVGPGLCWIFGKQTDVLIDGVKVGLKQFLTFYEEGQKSEYRILEYKVVPAPDVDKSDQWFLCKLYKKKQEKDS